MVEGIGSGDNKPSLKKLETIKFNDKELNKKISEYFEKDDSNLDAENKTSEIKDLALSTNIKDKANTVKDIRFLQNILNNIELYDIDFATQKILIQQKSDPDNFPVVAHRIVDGSENEENQFYYEFYNGNTYQSGDFGFDNIDSMFQEIREQLEEAQIEE